MAIQIEFPPEKEKRLREAAESQGLSITEYLDKLLENALPPARPPRKRKRQRTMADRFAGQIGLISVETTEILSEDCGEKFTEYLLKKYQEGHL